MDDGSTDNTCEVIKEYLGNVKLIRKRNGGAASARNVGISEAKGTYISFLDADDYWTSDKLERQISLFYKDPVLGLVYSDAILFEGTFDNPIYRIGERIAFHKGRPLRELFLNDFIATSTVMIKRELLEKVGYFNECLRTAEDWDLWLRILESGCEIDYVDDVLVKYRYHTTSISNSVDYVSRQSTKMMIIDQAFHRNPILLKDLYKRAKANVLLGTAQVLMGTGRPIEARGLLKQSIVLYPFDSREYTYFIFTYLPITFFALLRNWRRSISRIRTVLSETLIKKHR